MEQRKTNTEHRARDGTRRKKESAAGNVLGAILCVLLIPILIMNVTLIVKGAVNHDKVPTFGGYAPLIVLSDSMYPVIEQGDLIFVRSIDATAVRVGDVIAFFDPQSTQNAVLTHRVTALTEQDGGLAFQTKGDLNNVEDPALAPAENLVGLWTGVTLKGVGNVAMFLQTTQGLILCVGVPVVLLSAVELLRRNRYERSRKRESDALMAELEELRARQQERDGQ